MTLIAYPTIFHNGTGGEFATLYEENTDRPIEASNLPSVCVQENRMIIIRPATEEEIKKLTEKVKKRGYNTVVPQ